MRVLGFVQEGGGMWKLPKGKRTPRKTNKQSLLPKEKTFLYGQDERLATVPNAFCPKHIIYRLLPFWVSFVEHTIVLM